MKPASPCYQCPDRQPRCHGMCEKFKEYRSEVDKVNELERAWKYNEADTFLIEQARKQQKKRKR